MYFKFRVILTDFSYRNLDYCNIDTVSYRNDAVITVECPLVFVRTLLHLIGSLRIENTEI